jgi:hypothetical protein
MTTGRRPLTSTLRITEQALIFSALAPQRASQLTGALAHNGLITREVQAPMRLTAPAMQRLRA